MSTLLKFSTKWIMSENVQQRGKLCIWGGGSKGILVIGDKGKKLVVILLFEPKKCGELVILRSCGDGNLSEKYMMFWYFNYKILVIRLFIVTLVMVIQG